MRPSESGKMTFKAVASLAFVAAVIFAGFKIIPVYVDNYQLQDFIQGQTPYWLTQRAPAEAIRKTILAKAQELELPVDEDNVKVEANQSKVTVNIDYTVPVDFKVYTWQLHFTDSSENKSLT
jgi:ABC-type amino acid transport substrate-binding protein